MSTQDTIIANLTALGLNNPSSAALINKIAEGLGTVVDNTLTEFGNSESSILGIINNQRYGKSGYYTAAALAFQYGDNLTQDANGNPVYPVIDTTKQIISQAAFVELINEGSSTLFLKVACLDTSGNTVALSIPQLAAFTSYFLNFEIPGIPVTIISIAANVLNFTAQASYYATYDLPTLQANINAALTTFRQSFTFNGTFFSGDLQEYIKSNVPGVRDFFLSNTLIDSTPFNGSVTLTSGYFNYIATILSNITYLAV